MSDPIERVILSDGDVRVALLSIGCVTQDWQVPLNGEPARVVLGYRDSDAYRSNPAYLGAVVGRVANRIANARFTLDGRRYDLAPNDGPHHLHGGPGGLSHRLWQVERDGNRSVRFSLHSPDGDGGYPGAVDFAVTVTLDTSTLCYHMTATPDRPTPISLAQHNYYMLEAGGVGDQRLTLAADAFTPTGSDLIPTGEITSLDGQSHDFRMPRNLIAADPDMQGLDLNYCLTPGFGAAARLDADNGLRLGLETDQPGLQLYTATHLEQFAPPLQGQTHAPFRALCLEPQGWPDAVNITAFPGVIATPDRPYSQTTKITIQQRPPG